MPEFVLTTDRNQFVIHPKTHDVDALYQIPGYFHRKGMRHWSWPATAHVAGSMVDALAGRDVQFDAGWMEKWKQYQKEIAAAPLKDAEDLGQPLSNTDAWQHQRQAYAFLSELQAGALFDDMGYGKTKVAIDLVINSNARNVLVVCPQKAIAQWEYQFQLHGWNGRITATYPLEGRVVDRADTLYLENRPQGFITKVFVVNYEALSYKPVQTAINKTTWDYIVLDEAHKIKSPSGATSKFLYQLGRRYPDARRLALTGTPASDKPLDVFGIYRFLDPGIFGLSFSDFKERYAIVQRQMDKRGNVYEEILGYQNQEELHEKMFRIAYRSKHKIDLPPQHFVDHLVRLDPGNRQKYDRMLKESVLEIGDGSNIASNVITRILRLQEITCGFTTMKREDENESYRVTIGDEKLNAALELLDGIADTEPVVIFHRFTHDGDTLAETIRKHTSRSVYRIDGKHDERKRWNEDNAGSVLVVQIQSGSAALELQKASKVIYFSMDFSLTNYEQSLKRTHRPGQENPVTYWFLLAENTIDQYIFEAVRSKQEITDYLVNQLLAASRGER